MLKKNELEEFKLILVSLRARVRGDVDDLTAMALDRNGDGSDSKSPTHLAELGTETYEQDFALQQMENEQELLSEIEEALARVAAGTFGLCEGCVEQGHTPAKSVIPKARLKVIPYTRNCVECQSRREEYSM